MIDCVGMMVMSVVCMWVGMMCMRMSMMMCMWEGMVVMSMVAMVYMWVGVMVSGMGSVDAVCATRCISGRC